MADVRFPHARFHELLGASPLWIRKDAIIGDVVSEVQCVVEDQIGDTVQGYFVPQRSRGPLFYPDWATYSGIWVYRAWGGF